MAWNGTYKVKYRKRKVSRKQKSRSKKAKKVRRRGGAVRRQSGGQGSAALPSGYLSYPVSGKIPSIKIGDVDSVPTVMSKDDYEELTEEL